MKQLLRRPGLAIALATLAAYSPQVFASSHREAPITALDQKADITDWYAFISPEHPDRVVMILNVDPFLEPANGPNYFPFDPGILYEMKIDNTQSGYANVKFQFQFQTSIGLPGVFTGFVGNLAGIPPITALSGPGSEGLSLSQTYTVTMVMPSGQTVDLGAGQTLYAVPTDVGPRTMPNYAALRAQGVYNLGSNARVFAGTVADPFFIDLGAALDSLNFRMSAGGGVLSAAVDADDNNNYAPNTLGGYNVNSIVLEVPITWLTVDGQIHPATDKQAVIGTWGTTSRQQMNVVPGYGVTGTTWAQVQRLGNPLINEVIIGTGSKDKFSTDIPAHDAQFANFVLNPLLATIFSTIGIPVPPAPRTDLLLLVQYMAPICPGCGVGDSGPVADLLRLNTGIPVTPAGSQKRLAVLAGDFGGFPNGRRLNDDVFDIAARVVGGILVDSKKYGTLIGDGVNTPAVQPSATFPFEAPAFSGRDSSHDAGPGLPGCPVLAGGICPDN